MYAFKLLFLDALELLAWRWEGEKISPLARALFAPAVACKLGFWARFVALPLWLQPTVHTALCICATVCTGSFYLAFFFFISHNFDGVGSVGPKGSLPRSATFVQRQVETSSNVGGYWLGVLNGGLNFQARAFFSPPLPPPPPLLSSPGITLTPLRTSTARVCARCASRSSTIFSRGCTIRTTRRLPQWCARTSRSSASSTGTSP